MARAGRRGLLWLQERADGVRAPAVVVVVVMVVVVVAVVVVVVVAVAGGNHT